MALETGDDLEGPQFGDFSLNPSFGLDPSYVSRSISLVPKQINTDLSASLLGPTSINYTSPGTQIASLAPAPGQPTNAVPIIQGADLSQPQPVQVAENAGPGVAPPNRAPSATPQGTVPPPYKPFGGPPAQVDPNSELQTRRNQLQKESDDLYWQGNGAWRKLLDEDGAAKSRAERDQKLKEISDIDEKIQTQVTNQSMAKNYSLTKKMAPTAGPAAFQEEAIREWSEEGNFGARRGLAGVGAGDRAALYDKDGMNVLGRDVVKANELYSKLDTAHDETEYISRRADAIAAAKKGGVNFLTFKLTDADLPTTKKQYDDQHTLIQGTVKDATQMVNNYKRGLLDQYAPKPLTGDAGNAVLADSTLVGGAPSSNAAAKTLPALGGQQVTLYKNSTKDIADYAPYDPATGKGGKWTDWGTAEKEKASKMVSENPEIKGVLDQHNMAIKFNDTVQNDANYKDSTGRTAIADSAAGVFRNVSELSRAAGNIGLIKVWEHEMGFLEKNMNQAYTNWGTFKSFLNSGGKGEPPKLIPVKDPQWTPDTIAAFKRIGQFNLEEVSGRLSRVSGVANYVGEHAGRLQDVGVSDEAATILKPYVDRGTHQHRLALDDRDAIILNGRRYELPIDHSVDPSTPGFTPRGTYQRSLEQVNNNKIPPPPPPPPPAAGAFPAGGAAAVPFMTPGAATPPPAPAGGGGALRPLAATPAASLIQSLGGGPAAPAPTQVAQAQLPAAWGVGAQSAAGAFPTAPAVRPPVVSPGGGGPAAPVVAPSTTGGGGGAATVAPIPNYLRSSPVASTVFKTAGDTARNLSNGNVTVGNNVATIAASSAQSESAFKPHELHDKNQTTGEYAGYGLYGHQGDRLRDMQKSAGVAPIGKPGDAILPEAQTAFYAREIMDAAKKDPFIAKVLADPNPSAEDLTRVQLRMEQPKGYVKGREEETPSWNARLKNTQTLLQGQGKSLSSSPQQAEANYYGAQSGLMRAIPANAPAIGATVGGVAGTPWGAPGQAVGAIGGGALGGVAKNAMIGQDQSLTGYGKAGLEGGIEALPYAVPGTGYKALAGRALTAGAVEGGKELYETGGDIPKSLSIAGTSTLTSAASETFMLALGKTASGVYRMATRPNQQAMEDAGKILATQKPKTMLADGSTTENKAYTDAENYAKKINVDSDHLAHAYEETQRMASRGEALTSRPAYVEKRQAAGQLEDIKNQVGLADFASRNPNMTTVTINGQTHYIPGAPGAGPQQAAALQQKIKNDIKSPTDLVQSGAVPPQFYGDAHTAATEMAGKGVGQSPARNFGEVHDNFATARTTLLEKQREWEDMPIATPGRKEAIKAYTALGDHIREEQNKIIRGLLPPDQAQPLIDNLKATSKRYRDAVMAGGSDIVQTIAAGGAKGNQARDAFNRLAGNDQSAKDMMQALTTAENRKVKIAAYAVVASASQALHLVPVVGSIAAGAVGVMSAAKAVQMAKDYMVQKGAGKMVTMNDLLQQGLTKTQDAMRRGGATIGGSVGANVVRSIAEPAPAEAASP